ncbi:hypothetical protein [Leucobacter komagatae]|uniref:Uncharacterized protein n=1 Tax=Leucobacter komagatae TaxID=55969 RepID=A0A0D0IQR3_9MICO|nr:hypothetical protein [Leucobacter komagatae]KIP51843.1 hypothetical protein SD72_12970 [Leucobacter komagatae]
MRHSIWLTHSGIGRPTNTDGILAEQHDDADYPRPVHASRRLWVRSLLAFVAMLLFLASLIELVAVLVTDSEASVPFGVAGVCIAIAIVCTLAVTRNRGEAH